MLRNPRYIPVLGLRKLPVCAGHMLMSNCGDHCQKVGFKWKQHAITLRSKKWTLDMDGDSFETQSLICVRMSSVQEASSEAEYIANKKM